MGNSKFRPESPVIPVVESDSKFESHNPSINNEVEFKTTLPENKTAPIKKETENKLSKEPTNLFPKASLDIIGVKISKAKIVAKEVLGVEELELPDIKDLIKEFQRKNGLKVDGVVGKDTYLKMHEISEKSIILVKKAENGFNEYGLSKSTLKQIAKLLPHMMMQSRQYQRLMFLIGRFQSCKKYTKDSEMRDLLRDINGTSNEDKERLEKSKNYQSFYATIKDPNLSTKEKFEKIMTDPTLVMIGGLLFLFGVIGGDTKYTNSFMKRLGWIFGVSLFGRAAWDKLGLGEMIDDAEGIAGKTINAIKQSAEDAASRVRSFFKDDLGAMWKDIKDFKYSEIWPNIKKKFDSVVTGVGSYNDSLKGEGKNHKPGYIEPKPLSALVSLFGDDKFLNLKKTQLSSIGSISDLNGLQISSDVTGKLTKAKVTSKDISNFMKYHMGHAFEGNGKSNPKVKDLFLTTTILENIKDVVTKAKEEVAKTKSNYVNDNELNIKITDKVNYLKKNVDKNKQKLGSDLEIAIKTGNIEDFEKKYKGKISDSEILKLLSEVKQYFNDKKEYESLILQFDKIQLTGDLTKENIKEDLDYIEKIKTTNLKTDFFKKEFETEKTKKIVEILKAAQNNGFGSMKVTIGNESEKTINKYLESKEIEAKKSNILKELNAISLTKIPSISSTPKDFKKWWDDNKKSITVVEKLLNSNDNEIKTKANAILKKKDEFIENYKKVKEKYRTKLDEYRKKIKSVKVDASVDYKNTKEILEGISSDYIKNILFNVYSNNFTFDEIGNILKQIFNFKGLIVDKSFINSFEVLDKELGFNDNLKFDIVDIIKNKTKILEENYDVNIIGTITDVTTQENLKKIVSNLIEKHLNIVGFANDDIAERKTQELINQVNSVKEKFIENIKNITKINDLEDLYNSYENDFVSHIKTYAHDGKLFESLKAIFGFENDKVKKEYEKKKYDLKIEKFGKKSIKDVLASKGEIYNIYMKYLDLYKKIPEIHKQAVNFINDSNITVSSFIATLENNIALKKSDLTFNKDTAKLWDKGVNPLRESFTTNAEDLLKDIKAAIIK